MTLDAYSSELASRDVVARYNVVISRERTRTVVAVNPRIRNVINPIVRDVRILTLSKHDTRIRGVIEVVVAELDVVTNEGDYVSHPWAYWRYGSIVCSVTIEVDIAN